MPRAMRGDRKRTHGIAEWYGRLFREMTNETRRSLIGVKRGDHPICPFMETVPHLAPRGDAGCNKAGGVCSLREFVADGGRVVDLGPITATCPNRFLDGGAVFKEIGRLLLGTDGSRIVKEIPFLLRPKSSDDEASPGRIEDSEDVGRIDMVLVHPTLSRLNWCAVEMQAVYFSGGAMSKDLDVIAEHTGDDIPYPGANRRPDFRSSGPKRLMPQLLVKVPTLRRWGKKMAVVVDRPFFDSLGEMDNVFHVSNSDIVWFIVRFDEDVSAGVAKLVVDGVRYTTLERAVEGLTAGAPTSLDAFEGKLRDKLAN